MKKYILVLLLVVFIIPSVVFASWWNPFSWFQKTEPVAQPVATVQPVVPTPVKNSQISSDQTIQKNVPPSAKKNPVVKKMADIIITVPTQQIQAEPQPTQPTKSNAQFCIDNYGVNSVWTNTLNAQGGPICDCQTGYIWNDNRTSCQAPPQQDNALKIAQCQAKRDASNSKFTAAMDSMMEQGMETSKLQEQNAIANTYPPSQVGWEAYQINVNNIKNYYESLREQTKEKVAPLYAQGKASSDDEYLKCISQ